MPLEIERLWGGPNYKFIYNDLLGFCVLKVNYRSEFYYALVPCFEYIIYYEGRKRIIVKDKKITIGHLYEEIKTVIING